jgi:maltooligosyltrehalose trehalohydrolase
MLTASRRLTLGATVEGEQTHFRVWAPNAREVVARIIGRGDFPLERDEHGVFAATLQARAGDRYFYVLDGGNPLPDPVSRLLPEGVHGPAEIVDAGRYSWRDHTWKGLDFRDYIIYELHVGTFTPQGTFDGVIEKLPYLKSLGITAIEVMPVAANPGTRNWGYDAVSPYAVQANYGGPEGLRRLVDAAHRAGMAVVIDVIYNHLGNEGNYLRQFGPYFTDRHQTPWGEAVNYDQAGCEHVREYVRENARYWIREYHADGLRLDATQTIKDDSPRHIVREIARAVHNVEKELGRIVTVVAETDENDARYLRGPEEAGFGVDGVWSDDFHHAIHALLTGENKGYYADFATKPELLARIVSEGFGYQGEPFSFWKGRPRGTDTAGIPLYRHVICTQNHDQVGNRAKGERLNPLASYGARKVAAAILLLAFQFFTDYGDPTLQEAVREGRRSEFKDFAWDEVPDPQDPGTFERSRLSWVGGGNHGEMLDWYRELIALRKRVIVPSERSCHAEWKDGVLRMEFPARDPRLLLMAGFRVNLSDPGDGWERAIWMERDGYSVGVYRRA